MTIWQGLLAWLIIFVCALLILVVLIQRGRGGGLAGAFGGTGGSSAFGAKTGDVFTWITVIMAAVWGLLAVVANFYFDKSAVATPPVTATSLDELPVELGTEGAVPAPVPGDQPAAVPSGTAVPAEGSPVDQKPSTEPAPAEAAPIEAAPTGAAEPAGDAAGDDDTADDGGGGADPADGG